MNSPQIQRIINFFRINHQFHEPYQLLLDGNFIKLLVEKGISLKFRMDQITKGRCTLRVTSCILRELQLLGDHFRLVLQQARQYRLTSCKHSLENTVDECILEQIGISNQKQLIICSQDMELRRNLRDRDNVPIMYFGPDQRITMEDIHKKTLKMIQQEQANKFMPQQQEMKEVNELKKRQAQVNKKLRIKEMSSQRGIQLKTRIAKGPNPLSVRKKQQKSNKYPQKQSTIEDKRKRIRKRRNRGQDSQIPE